MKKLLLAFILIVSGQQLFAKAPDNDCRSLMKNFITRSDKLDSVALITNDWKVSDKKKFYDRVVELGFSNDDIKIIANSLNTSSVSLEMKQVEDYLKFVLVLSVRDQQVALRDLTKLGLKDANSKHVKRFLKYEAKIKEKFSKTKMTGAEQARYKELYYGCRALRPNSVNANAAKDFKRFNMSLSLGTLAASYAFYNMDKEKDAEWFARLGYDIGITILFSYVGSAIQTKATDNQIVKSLKSYFSGRVMGITDVVIYDPLFNDERKQAEAKYEELKKDPNFKAKVDVLLEEYKKRGIYRQYKDALINTIKKLPEVGLGIKGNSIDSNNIDWNNLTHADLERPEVQEVLVAAAMAQVYQESKGDWIETSDIGLDRYAFNSIFYGVQIPRSIVQNYITYQMLCMGQDAPKMAFTKAVLFNVSMNFIVNQALFGYREKAINQ